MVQLQEEVASMRWLLSIPQEDLLTTPHPEFSPSAWDRQVAGGVVEHCAALLGVRWGTGDLNWGAGIAQVSQSSGEQML